MTYEPTDKELFALEMLELNHKCNPVERMLYRITHARTRKDFSRNYEEGGGIGLTFTTHCNRCGREFWAADTETW